MAGGWNPRDPWDDGDSDDAWEDPPSQRTPGQSSYQQRAYQRPQQPPAQRQPYGYGQQQPYASSSSNWRAASARGRVPGRGQPQADPPRSKVGPIIGGVVSVVAGLALLAFLGRDQLKALIHPTPTPTSSAPALVLPAFSDWRVAYVGQDGQLHAVSLNGKTDVSGASLPALTASAATPATTATTTTNPATLVRGAASPDGHYLTYVGSGPVLIHLSAQAGDQDAVRSGTTVPSSLLWSPDSAKLAWLATNGAVHLDSVAALTDATVPATAGQGIQEILGWIDATHLAVRVSQPNATTEQIAALDISNGQQRVIVTLTKTGYGTLHYRLSPDGARFLAWNSPITGQAFTAIFRNYDTKTGTVKKLPNTLASVGTNVSAVAWKPGAAVVAIASGSGSDLKLWLVNAAGDSATSIGSAYPLGWLSDGSQLITSSASAAKLGGGPYTISAVTFPTTGAPTRVTLTDKAMSFPWLGLVRTA